MTTITIKVSDISGALSDDNLNLSAGEIRDIMTKVRNGASEVKVERTADEKDE